MKVLNSAGREMNMSEEDFERLSKMGLQFTISKREKIADIIIPHHDRHDHLKRCLDGIDNSSFYIHIESGGSFAENCNEGAKHAKTNTLIFLNDDVETEMDALLALARTRQDYCGISQYMKGKKYYGMGYKDGKWIMADKEEDFLIPSGYCMKFTKRAWNKLGGLNESFKNGGEDHDIGMRALDAGLSVGCIDFPMVHRHSQSKGRLDNVDYNVNLLDKMWTPAKIKELIERKAKQTPVLFTTFNRLDYTKKTLPELQKSVCGEIIVIDNASTDGTQEWLKKQEGIRLILNSKNEYVAGAMNQFFELTKRNEYIAKVDNDTIVEKDWLIKLLEHATQNKVDIVQAKHHLISETHPKGFKEYVKDLPKMGTVRLNRFVGGSGVVIKRKIINENLKTDLGVLSGWTHWQHNHPETTKGFDTSVEIMLLDTKKKGETIYNKYPDYYKFTGRLCEN